MAGDADWTGLGNLVWRHFPGGQEELGALVVTLVLALVELRRTEGAKRAAALRRCVSLLPTIRGLPRRQGWVVLRTVCPFCGTMPWRDTAWIAYQSAEHRRLIPLEELEADPRRTWLRWEQQSRHTLDVEQFFSEERGSGRHCAMCGEEWDCRARGPQRPPSLLLGVQLGDGAEAAVAWYTVEAPEGTSERVVHLLRLALAMCEEDHRPPAGCGGTCSSPG